LLRSSHTALVVVAFMQPLRFQTKDAIRSENSAMKDMIILEKSIANKASTSAEDTSAMEQVSTLTSEVVSM